jgi:hypothetical protein
MIANRTSLVALTLGASLLVAAGCGVSDAKLARAELILKADPYCERANNALKDSGISPSNLAVVAPHVGKFYLLAANQLAGLKPPSSIAADWRAIVDGYRVAGEQLEKLGEAVRAKDRQVDFQAQALFTKAQHDRAITAFRNGFEACSKY